MRREYNTKQRREMLAFLKRNDLRHYSVDDFVFEMEQHGEKIGRTTAYRFLESLAEQGSVRKYQNARGITQYQHVAHSTECDAHFHMMCKSCGKLYHVNCDLMSQLTSHIFSDHNFRVDPRETILVGTCTSCGESDGEGDSAHGADHAEGCHHCL